MKERAILFNGEMVRAILAGRMTQKERFAAIKDLAAQLLESEIPGTDEALEEIKTLAGVGYYAEDWTEQMAARGINLKEVA